MLPVLNLPAIEPKLNESNGKIWIFDGIRKKYVVLTPEEWVRQHFVNYLLTQTYPRTLIKIEGGLSVNELRKRSDIVVYTRDGKPWMVIECKNPLININETILQQAANYNTKLRAKYLTVSNGLKHYYFETDWRLHTVKQIENLPGYEM